MNEHFAAREKFRIRRSRFDATVARRKDVGADSIPPPFEHRPPRPAAGFRVFRVERFGKFLLEFFLTSGGEERGGGPTEFVIVEEFVTVMRE
jgi:hypothetical protein